MITPVFSITQDDEFLYVFVKAPFSKVSDCDIVFGDKELLFSAPPYYLRLYLPQPVVENGQESGKYDADEGQYEIRAPKLHRGTNFEGLDMITKLLTPVGRETAGNLVEEVSSGDVGNGSGGVELDRGSEAATFVREEEQQKPTHIPSVLTSTVPVSEFGNGYGFGGMKHGIVSKLREELSMVFDIQDPDSMSASDREQYALRVEQEQFCPDYYLMDYFSAAIQDFLEAPLFSFSPVSSENGFSSEELERLKELPKRTIQVPLSLHADQMSQSQLVEILFGYAYDMRVTEGEGNVESHWTISKLSSSLSCLSTSLDLSLVMNGLFRRSLSYPLHRHWKLTNRVRKDVIAILHRGKKFVLKCILAVHKIFASSGDYKYILNDLFVTDMLIWLQYIPLELMYESTIANLAFELENLDPITKDSMMLESDLTELEMTAEMSLLDTIGNGQLKGGDDDDDGLGVAAVIDEIAVDSDDDDDDADAVDIKKGFRGGHGGGGGDYGDVDDDDDDEDFDHYFNEQLSRMHLRDDDEQQELKKQDNSVQSKQNNQPVAAAAQSAAPFSSSSASIASKLLQPKQHQNTAVEQQQQQQEKEEEEKYNICCPMAAAGERVIPAAAAAGGNSSQHESAAAAVLRLVNNAAGSNENNTDDKDDDDAVDVVVKQLDKLIQDDDDESEDGEISSSGKAGGASMQHRRGPIQLAAASSSVAAAVNSSKTTSINNESSIITIDKDDGQTGLIKSMPTTPVIKSSSLLKNDNKSVEQTNNNKNAPVFSSPSSESTETSLSENSTLAIADDNNNNDKSPASDPVVMTTAKTSTDPTAAAALTITQQNRSSSVGDDN